MRCDHCARPPDSPCLGERLPHLCGLPAYVAYLAGAEGSTGTVEVLAQADPTGKPDGREAICLACPELIAGLNECRSCGCHMTAWLRSACPVSKW